MSSNNFRHGIRLGLREHLMAGQRVTELESIVMFGVTSLRDMVHVLRKEGWVVQAQLTPYATALRRVNEYAVVQSPKNLPVREIMLTEYWIER